ncbi:hypothetical protein [Clostridium gasigenes]|uniref:hypothetical protein n=1 Tax=Clostridium gasigenes TaxID=94869 RepID=UPI00209B77DD|nr:hypothetical protein [Clostridium gasigenes]
MLNFDSDSSKGNIITDDFNLPENLRSDLETFNPTQPSILDGLIIDDFSVGSELSNSLYKGITQVLDYVKDNRVPLDKETALGGKEYNKTNIKVKGAQAYKNGDKYYYRDTFHTGEASHLEVFDKRGNHIGEANPQTGELIPGTADPTKKINVK